MGGDGKASKCKRKTHSMFSDRQPAPVRVISYIIIVMSPVFSMCVQFVRDQVCRVVPLLLKFVYRRVAVRIRSDEGG